VDNRPWREGSLHLTILVEGFSRKILCVIIRGKVSVAVGGGTHNIPNRAVGRGGPKGGDQEQKKTPRKTKKKKKKKKKTRFFCNPQPELRAMPREGNFCK